MAKVFPYSDEKMVYDAEIHRYVLTELAVMQELGENLGEKLDSFGDNNPSTLPQRWLKRVSLLIYNRIYNCNHYREYFEYLLAKDGRFRDVLYRAMLEQVLYLLINGDVGLQAGVNLKDGRAMDIDNLRGRARFSPDALDILMNAGLLYQGFICIPNDIVFGEGY